LEATLIAVALNHAGSETGYELMVLESPTRDGEERGGGLGDETFEDEVGSEAFDEVDDEVDVFVGGEEMKVGRILFVFLCHPGASNELELVELECGEGKGGKDVGFSKDGFPTLAWKSQNQVSACADATSGCTLDGIDGLSVGVTSVDALEGGVIDRFDTVFDHQEGALVELFEVIQQGIRHAVRTSADDKTNHVRNRKCLLVFGFQMGEGIVGVGICLEVSEILHVGVFAGKELFSLLQLLSDGLGGDAIVGIEGLVVAIGATACAHPTIAIGTSKTCIEGNFLRLHSQLLSQPNSVLIV